MPYIYCDPQLCTGCRACELVCPSVHERVFNPRLSRIRVVRLEFVIDIAITCRQCENAPCIAVCPSGALRKSRTGLVEVIAERCIGCSACSEACPFGAIELHDGKVIKCDLCGGDPACVKRCTPKALKLVSSEQVAEEERHAYVAQRTRKEVKA